MLTQVPGYPEKRNAVPGMAYFAGTGPAGKTCETCAFRGYQREGMRRGELHWFNWNGCAKFKQLAGSIGPVIRADNKACKYYEAKPKDGG